MYRLNRIKQTILIISFSTLLVGCGGGSGSTTSTDITTPTVITTPKAKHEGQVKDNLTGVGLEKVNVSIGSHTVTTDSEGYYIFSDLTESKEAIINFEKKGYLLGNTKIQIKVFSEDNTPAINYLEYKMHAHDYQWNYESTDEISAASIAIDATYHDKELNPYHGTILAELTILDTTTDEGKTLFPGAFEGINTNGSLVQFKSYGLVSILLKDSKDNTLSLSDGQIGTVIFNNVSYYEDQSILPLWYYDYEQGLWFEEGYAELQEDGTYKGEIPHLGTWSLNKAIESDPGIFRAHIFDEDGSPVSNVRVNAIGNNWISSDLSTDEDGLFELKVIPDESFKLSAYNYKEKYGATYDFIIPAIASGDILED